MFELYSILLNATFKLNKLIGNFGFPYSRFMSSVRQSFAHLYGIILYC